MGITGTYRKKTKKVIMPNYSEEAAQIVAKMLTSDYEDEKALGFDIKDIKTIINFELDYTPLHQLVLVKQVQESAIIGVNGSITSKYVVVEVSPDIQMNLRKGDIVVIGGVNVPQAASMKRKIKGINLIEVDAFSISGIYCKIEDYLNRKPVYQDEETSEPFIQDNKIHGDN